MKSSDGADDSVRLTDDSVRLTDDSVRLTPMTPGDPPPQGQGSKAPWIYIYICICICIYIYIYTCNIHVIYIQYTDNIHINTYNIQVVTKTSEGLLNN